jgi:hypothetical protein
VAGAVFIKGLGTALLDVLCLVAAAFYPVAHYCTADYANYCSQCPPIAIANGVANCTARYSAQQSATTRFWGFGGNLLAVTHAAWHSDLLHHGRAGDHAGQNISG